MASQGSARPATSGAGSPALEAHEESHGHSVASWTLVALVLIGTFLICLGIVLTHVVLAVIGAIICVLGLAAGRLLQMAGFGVHPPAPKSH